MKNHEKSLVFYAQVIPGAEDIAVGEIEQVLGGEIRKIAKGVVVFRLDGPDPDVLELKTTEDVFLYAWGTDALSFRAKDLEDIQKWTSQQPDWKHLLAVHQQIREIPKGRPSFHVVTQMDGKHGYFRKDAQKYFLRGLEKVIPSTWRQVEENASAEFWLTIDGATAICGLRLSDRRMRHREYKRAHRPASLRPSLAAGMVRLAELKPYHRVLDPMCGVGTLLAEYQNYAEQWRVPRPPAIGGDLEMNAVRDAQANLRGLGANHWFNWDATHLPLNGESIHRVICNPPFGKQISPGVNLPLFYSALVAEFYRVLLPQGKMVLLVSDHETLRGACEKEHFHFEKKIKTKVLGQTAFISVWKKR
ncbi:MAG: RNA methyltransferase [Gemmataceae bacterium]|nr:RNA methyltransferase [Gemmataceae bacterium]